LKMALSTSTQALDEIFKRLMESAGVAPGADRMEVIKGTKREQWAFPEGKSPVNVTPFQDRTLDEQKVLGTILAGIYGHGAGYEQSEASKAMAKAAMAQAGAANTNAATNKKALDELLKRNAEAAKGEDGGADGGEDYTGMPSWAPTINKPTGRVAAPTGTARTTGGPGLNPATDFNFEMTPEKLAAFGINPQGQGKPKKKKTGNPWEDGGYGSYVSTLK
jgi:hypothetical protein